MIPDPTPTPGLNRVCRPAKIVGLKFEPLGPEHGPVDTSPLVHVRRPAKIVSLKFEPVDAACLELTITPADKTDASAPKFARLVDHLSEYDKTLGGAGVTRDATRSRAEPGAVTLVLVPVNPAGAEARLEVLAQAAVVAGGYAGEAIRAEVKRSAA